MSGGKGVEPLQLDQIKPFVPETFAGLPRTNMRRSAPASRAS